MQVAGSGTDGGIHSVESECNEQQTVDNGRWNERKVETETRSDTGPMSER